MTIEKQRDFLKMLERLHDEAEEYRELCRKQRDNIEEQITSAEMRTLTRAAMLFLRFCDDLEEGDEL